VIERLILVFLYFFINLQLQINKKIIESGPAKKYQKEKARLSECDIGFIEEITVHGPSMHIKPEFIKVMESLRAEEAKTADLAAQLAVEQAAREAAEKRYEDLLRSLNVIHCSVSTAYCESLQAQANSKK
jgi:hypothetical protein